jgi:hypothetical protein
MKIAMPVELHLALLRASQVGLVFLFVGLLIFSPDGFSFMILMIIVRKT